MAFVPRVPGRISKIPTVSTFSLAAREKKTAADTRVMFRWLTQHKDLATDEEWAEVIDVLEIARGEYAIMLPMLMKLRGNYTKFSIALTNRFYFPE